ncbi:MAG: hypothetical protein ACLGH8_06715 [Bacteroidia bacterium]|jgi:hypothetical protein
MNQYENETRIVRPNYMLVALVMVTLGYYITFHIAEQPHMPNAPVLKALGIACMLVFSALLVLSFKKEKKN